MEALVKTEFESLESFLDYLEALLGTPTWPRYMMTKATKGQILASSRKFFQEKLGQAQFQDCYVATHGERDKLWYQLRAVFLDFDAPNNIALAISDAILVAQKVEEEFGVKPHVQFSGSKGAHVFVPIDPIDFEDLSKEKRFLAFVQKRYDTNNLDKQIIGDVSRLIRVPYTINTKALETPWKGHVKILQTWNGKYANLEKLLQIFEATELLVKTTKPEKPNFAFFTKKHIRKEVQELIERAKQGVHLTHHQRLAIAFELIANGYSDDEIVEIFKTQTHDFNENKTRGQLKQIREKGYRPYKTENLLQILKEVDEE